MSFGTNPARKDVELGKPPLHSKISLSYSAVFATQGQIQGGGGNGPIAPPPGEFGKEKPTGTNIGKSPITDNHFHIILLE